MAGSIEDNAAIYNKQHHKCFILPPSELIDCTIFTVDFTDRKTIVIGLDPANTFNVAVRIITSTRYICISIDLLRRIYSMMGYILSIISDQPAKCKERIFLKDEMVTLSKAAYRGDNMLLIKSHRENDECRIQLNRENLLILQTLEGCINETITRKTIIDRPVVLEQLDRIATYLKSDFYREESSTLKEITMSITGIHPHLITSNVPVNITEPNFINQIILFARTQVAQCWLTKLHNDLSLKVILLLNK